jgi:hypothetical protein
VRETELGKAAAEWLRSRGLAVHQEVVTPHGRADAVGRGAGLVVAVECKVSLGLDVIAQALRWRPYASESWVCVPASKRRPSRDEASRRLAREVIASKALGLVEVRPDGACWFSVEAPTHYPKDGPAFWDRYLLQEQQSRGEAGSATGGHVTQFSLTAERLCAFVEANPGVTLGEALRRVEHHYSNRASARASLDGLLRRTKDRPASLAPIRIDGIGSKATLWPQPVEDF